MTMQDRHGSAQTVTAEEHQQLHSPAGVGSLHCTGAGKTSFHLQLYVQGKMGLLLPHQTSAFP